MRADPHQVDRLVEEGRVSLPPDGALIEPYDRWTELLAAWRWCLASWRRSAASEAKWEQ